jgi:hypothetical protein
MPLRLTNFLISQFKQLFKTEDTRFIVSVGLKVSGISFCITIFVYWFLMEVMRLNYAFFRAHGFATFADGTPFYDLILMEASDNLPLLFGFHILLFFIGSYVGWLILRPFKAMADYCDQVIEKPNTIYKVDEFSTYNLFTRFSEFFFEYLRESRHRNQIVPNSIPPQYSRIHKPVMDKVFMLHFGFLLIIIAIISGYFITDYSTTIYESMVELATRTLKDQKSVSKFISEQMFILDDIVILTMVLIAVSYTMLGFHLYAKVSGAAFAIFSTMRSFMKGNCSSRVHLVGYAYLRDYTRKLNKYLDYVQNYIAKDPPKNKTL